MVTARVHYPYSTWLGCVNWFVAGIENSAGANASSLSHARVSLVCCLVSLVLFNGTKLYSCRSSLS